MAQFTRLLALSLFAAALFILAACSSEQEAPGPADVLQKAENDSPPPPPPPPPPEPLPGAPVLVAPPPASQWRAKV